MEEKVEQQVILISLFFCMYIFFNRFYSGYIDISEFMKPNELKTSLASVKQEACPPFNPSWNETLTPINQPHISPNNIPNTTTSNEHEIVRFLQ
jgi:hypothetical protein